MFISSAMANPLISREVEFDVRLIASSNKFWNIDNILLTLFNLEYIQISKIKTANMIGNQWLDHLY